MMDKYTAPHYTWGKACDAWVLIDTPSLSVKGEAMPPGEREALHFHVAAQQFFFILGGTANLYVNDEKQLLKEGQGLLVLPKAKHFIANEGEEPLSFLVISQPSTNNDRMNIEEEAKQSFI